ncbi:AAA family ATPase [Rhizobium sp. NZLR3b]|uniref:ATP-binding protein n=1 Tax=Rhizobium sp. NZLR3b TaxID=2731101 RepID=UPI001C83A95A|nr:helix-turn-helix transcriptional regulator [Rhizobium sp. NZLR3b]MBX5193494.1 AAA family ATPase [Rhizobium sp. NZLR3b]
MKPLFVGRDTEIEVIDRLFQSIQENGSVVVVQGEPGIGKSVLLSTAAERAVLRDMQVLNASGVSAEAQMPFAGLHQLLRPILHRADALPPPQQSALLSAFGMVTEVSNPNLFLIALATLTLLTECASRQPLAVLLDDAHWLDQPTFDVLAFVARRIQADAIVLIAAFRDDSPKLLGDGSALRLVLGGLDDDAARTILAAFAPESSTSLRKRVIREAAGNPLALVELPRGGEAQRGGEAGWLRLSHRLERTFLGRVSELPATSRTSLFVAAENDGASLHEVLRAAGELVGQALDASVFAAATSVNLVEIDGDNIRFRHPLVRSAIHQSLDFATFQAVHQALAAAILNQQERALWHYAASIREPDEKIASELHREAERSRRRGGAAMAMATFESAARLSESAGTRTPRLLHAAELAVELGQLDAMDRLLSQVDNDSSDPAAPARVAWILELSQTGMVNDPGRVSALIASAAQAREAGEIELAVNLLLRASQRCWWGNARTSTSEDIKATAEQIGSLDNSPQLTAIFAYGSPLEHGQTVLTQLRNFAALGDMDPTITRMLGSAANVIGAFDIGLPFLTHANAGLREQGRLGDLARVLFAQAWAQVEVGDWNGALQAAEECTSLSQESGGQHWIAAGTIVKARVAAMRGDTAAFESGCALAERIALPLAASFLLAMLQLARGSAAISWARHAEALEHLQRMFDASDPAYNTSIQFYATIDLVDAAIGVDRPAAAWTLIEEIDNLTAGQPVPWVRASLKYAKAMLAGPDQADDLFDEALRLDLRPWPYLRGRLLLAYGARQRRLRRPADARSPLRIARDIFDALGAAPWGDRARQELRASGEASRRRPDNIASLLSPQELHIAQLAAGGLTNKEIASRLYLSHRTVGFHLHRIFPKLGITARAGLRDAITAPKGF